MEICRFGCLPTIKAGLSVNFYAIEVGKRDLSPLPSPELSDELRFGSFFQAGSSMLTSKPIRLFGSDCGTQSRHKLAAAGINPSSQPVIVPNSYLRTDTHRALLPAPSRRCEALDHTQLRSVKPQPTLKSQI
jgi:hypothetical protein